MDYRIRPFVCPPPTRWIFLAQMKVGEWLSLPDRRICETEGNSSLSPRSILLFLLADLQTNTTPTAYLLSRVVDTDLLTEQ